MNLKAIVISILIVAVSAGIIYYNRVYIYSPFFTPRNQSPVEDKKGEVDQTKDDISIIASNLDIPWELVFLQKNEMLVTQRGGNLLKVGMDSKIIKEIEGVKHIGEGGLLGMVLHPNFQKNNYLYLYSTTSDSGKITNRVERYVFKNDLLSERKIIIQGINGSKYHDGGRIAFGPDGYLYIATGDAESPDSAQDKNSLSGKILRVMDDGGIPADNPFGNAVYSLGHRNPQGLTWDKDGNFWSTEHGPSGAQTGNDEVNLIIRGGNYGWPTIQGDQSKEGLISPVIQSGTKDTWAPSGVAYLNGSLYFAGLRGEALYEAKIKEGKKLELITHNKSEFGRVRTVVVGPDGFIYILTNNTDGRGRPRPRDDKIIRLSPKTKS